MVSCWNRGHSAFVLEPLDRLAQLVFLPVLQPTFLVVDDFAVSARGTGGFGYDPVFYFPALAKSFAELSSTEKNLYSHRGKAFRRLLQALPNML